MAIMRVWDVACRLCIRTRGGEAFEDSREKGGEEGERHKMECRFEGRDVRRACDV